MLKHKVDNIKRMCAHPSLAVYLTGGQDGSVQLWEWGHQQVVSTPRPPGTFAKVTRCRFSPHGNKFGIADGDGNLSLWQAGMASQCNRPFFVSRFWGGGLSWIDDLLSFFWFQQTMQCHNKGITDFEFLGSCSLIATSKKGRWGFIYRKEVNRWSFLSLFPFSAGHSSENKNVGMWDTLLPQKKAMVACELMILLG